MKRTALLLEAGILCAGIAGAQAPEMRKFLPKEWEYLRLYEGDLTQQLTAACVYLLTAEVFGTCTSSMFSNSAS